MLALKSAESPALMDRHWVARAVSLLEDESCASQPTSLIPLPLPELPGVDLYLKDETSHPSGSLKHRLARSLFLHGICNGDIGPDTVIVEASSGSTAISEAWYARLLGLQFVAVVPKTTAVAKLAGIKAADGRLHLAEPDQDCCALAASIAARCNGHFMDQFTHAERVTDWRGNNNIAESLFAQMGREPHPIPSWIVVGAGTGGTSATIGRYIRLRPHFTGTRLCVVDPEGSAFFKSYETGDVSVSGCSSRVVEGIGRPRVEASFMPRLIDMMLCVPDSASIAAARWVANRYCRSYGPSTGTNIFGALTLARTMQDFDERGSIVTLACDSGDRYSGTIYDDGWVAEHEPHGLCWEAMIGALVRPSS